MSVYTVQSNYVDSYSDTNMTSVVTRYNKGQEVNISSLQGKWGQVSNRNEYIILVHLKKGSVAGDDQSKLAINMAENYDEAVDETITGHKDSDYNQLLLRYIRAFGAPPRYSEQVDPYYSTDTNGIYVGRVMASTWFSNPSIMSICPGTVDYLPGFNAKEKDDFFNKVKAAAAGMGDVLDRIKDDHNKSKDGQLYAFKSRYNDYMNVVNAMARTSALLLGIGDVDDIIHGTSIPLKNFDYGFFTTPSDAAVSNSLFSTAAASLSTAVSDSSYIHFFVNHSGGSKMSEQITTESGKSYFESLIDDQSGISQAAQNLQFLFGGAISAEVKDDFDSLIGQAVTHNQFLGGVTTIASNYLKGGRLVFPQMITGMRYEKSITCELQFTSLYGDKRSIFKYTILPALHLLAMATPIQLSGNMYTYPFLVRCYQCGVANCDLAFIQNLQLTRGGNDDSSWTVDGLPTEINASFEITPLYSNLMVTSARNPFMFLQNTSLLEYLGNMCGVDLKANNIHVKIDLAKKLLSNYFTDIPTTIARGFTDSKFVNEIKKWAQIIN